jgi:hypothetical protein
VPILFGLFGLILIVAGVRGRVNSGSPSLVSLVKDDFTGTNPFWKWMLAILLIGAVGYIPNLRPISRGFMALVIVVFLLSNQGLFTQLTNTFKSGTLTETGTNTVSETGTNTSSTTDQSLNSDQTGQLMNVLDILSKTSGQ